MKNNLIKKAGLYIRTSTDNQQDSIHLQRQELRNYCHSKGWVVHEMCHLKYKNHSKEYWDSIKTIMPDYEQRKEWLRVNGKLLSI